MQEIRRSMKDIAHIRLLESRTPHKVINGTRILKPGQDAHKAIVLDITWTSVGSQSPHIEWELVNVADWKPDENLTERVKTCYSPLDCLVKTQLTIVPQKFRPLSSVN